MAATLLEALVRLPEPRMGIPMGRDRFKRNDDTSPDLWHRFCELGSV